MASNKKTEELDPRLELLLTSLKKDFGADSIVSFKDGTLPGVEFISSSCVSLDRALGGGYARGRIIEAYGPESAGKTSLALHAIAEAQRQDLTCAFIDTEHSLDLKYARDLGVQVDKLLFSQPDSGETALQIAERMVRSGVVGLIVIDSVAALVPQKELEGEIGDQIPGAQARLMSQAMRKLAGACHTSNCTVLFTNQIRFAIGVMYGNPERRPGGEALKFFASQRLEIRRIATEKADEVAIANKVRVKVVKNKIAPPFRECELTLVFGKGLDYTTDTLNLAVEAGLVEKSGAHYSLNGEKIAHGEDKAVEWLEAHPEALQSLKDQLLEHNEISAP